MGFLLSILCGVTRVSDKLSCSTCSLKDVKVETHRCEVWFEFNDFSQIGQSRLGLPHCQKHCGSAVVSHVVLWISVWQTSKEGWQVRKVWNSETVVQKWSARYFFSASYQQLRGSETRRRLAVRRRAASCPSPCDCPRCHPFHTSLLQNIWQTTHINRSILAHTCTQLCAPLLVKDSGRWQRQHVNTANQSEATRSQLFDVKLWS